jgi:hypothetical protein
LTLGGRKKKKKNSYSTPSAPRRSSFGAEVEVAILYHAEIHGNSFFAFGVWKRFSTGERGKRGRRREKQRRGMGRRGEREKSLPIITSQDPR